MHGSIGEAAMKRNEKTTPTLKLLDRAAGYVSGTGPALSFWILSAAFLLGRVLVIPF
jgi:hypothetical protein